MGEKIFVIARTTYFETARQAVFYILIAIFGVLILLSPFITLFWLQDISPVIKEMGIASVIVCGLFLSFLSATRVVGEEIENKTALTLLAKPVGREVFLVGKFLGVFWGVVLGCLFLFLLLVLTVWWHDGHTDAIRTTLTFENYLSSHLGGFFQLHVVVVLKAFFLAILQVMVLTALAIALSTVLPMFVGFCVMLVIFAAGHLVNYLGAELGGGVPGALGSLIAFLVPNLETLDVGWAMSSQIAPSWAYLGLSTLYAAVYCLATLLVGMALFRERELM